MKEKLQFMPTLKDAFAIGAKNILSIVAATILWAITIWIPYINVGTTIAMSMLPVKLSRGEIVNPTYIFDSEYRHIMGEYLILQVLISSAVLLAMGFMFFPGIVLGLSWSLATYLLIDKKMNWALCLSESNRLTMGYKKRIFWLSFVLSLVFVIAFGLVFAIFDKVPALLVIVFILLYLLAVSVTISLNAVIYRELALTEPEEAA